MTLRVEVPGDKVISLDKVLHIGKVANIEQCKCNNTFGTELKKKETTLSRRLKEYLKALWAFRTKITVEPFVICYILPSVLAGLAVQNLCLEKSCLVNLGYDKDTCTHIMQGRTSNYTKAERDVQVMVTKMTAWSYPLQTALPGILTLFVGAWTDRTGNRKTFMVLPILGKLISAIGLILSTIFFFQVDLNVTALIEGLPPAIAGGRVAMTMAVYSYITDITSESERTFRLGIITAIVTLGRPVGLALSGIMTNRFGYYGVFTFACTCYLIGFVYIVLRLKTNKIVKKVDDCKEKKFVLNVFAKDFLATVNVAFKSRAKSSRLQIILIMLAYMLIVGPVIDDLISKAYRTNKMNIKLRKTLRPSIQIGEAQMTYWFTRYKFKFTEVDYSLFLTYSVLIGSIGSFVTIYFFTKRWKIDDSIIGVVACVSRISGGVLYALAPNRTIYFIGPVLDMFSSASATSLRSMATKLVNDDEIGKTSSLISISEALVPVIYSPIYSKVYLATLSRFPGAFYLISAALAVPAIAIFIILHLLRRREWQQENASTIEPEKKPKDDEVTRF